MDNQDKIFNKIKSAAQKAEQQDFPGMEKLWARVEDKLEQQELKSKSQLWKKLAIAASLLLFVSLGYQFFKNDNKINSASEINENKVVIQKNESTRDRIVPSEKIKTEAPEILQKQLEKQNPVTIIENHNTKDNDTNVIFSKAKAEETTPQADAIINQEPSSALSVAPMASVMAKSYTPTTTSEYKETAKITAVKTSLTNTITGVITDEKDNLPIPGASVSIKGTKNTAITDFDGKYTIDAEKGKTLIFNTIGYNSHEAIVGNSNKINPKLSPTSNALNEIVVVGYGTKKAKLAAAKVEISAAETMSFAKEKTVPQIKDALYIINGVEYDEASLFGSNPTSPYAPLSKQKIEKITIYQNAEAIEKYGEKGKNGVIIITTKNGIPLKR